MLNALGGEAQTTGIIKAVDRAPFQQADRLSPDVAPSRRLTSRQLQRRITALPRFQRAREYVLGMSCAGEYVLSLVCDLAAEGEEPGVIRIEPGAGDLAEMIAAHGRKIHRLSEVRAGLDDLYRFRVLRNIEGGISLPDETLTKPSRRVGNVKQPTGKRAPRPSSIEPTATPSHRSGVTLSGFRAGGKAGWASEDCELIRENWGYSGGGNMAGLTSAETAEARFQEAKRKEQAKREQRRLNLLTMVHDVAQHSSENPPGNPPENPPRTLPENPLRTPSKGSRVPLAGFGTLSVVAASGSLESWKNQQQQHGTNLPPTRCENPPARTHEQGVLIAEGSQPSYSPQVDELARDAVAAFGLRRMHAEEASALIQGHVEQGHTLPLIREKIEKQKRTGIPTNSLRFLSMSLPALATPAASTSSPASLAPIADPAVAADPEWSTLPAGRQRGIAAILAHMNLPSSGERQRLLSAAFSYQHDSFKAVAARRPELWAMADKDQADV